MFRKCKVLYCSWFLEEWNQWCVLWDFDVRVFLCWKSHTLRLFADGSAIMGVCRFSPSGEYFIYGQASSILKVTHYITDRRRGFYGLKFNFETKERMNDSANYQHLLLTIWINKSLTSGVGVQSEPDTICICESPQPNYVNKTDVRKWHDVTCHRSRLVDQVANVQQRLIHSTY